MALSIAPTRVTSAKLVEAFAASIRRSTAAESCSPPLNKAERSAFIFATSEASFSKLLLVSSKALEVSL